MGIPVLARTPLPPFELGPVKQLLQLLCIRDALSLGAFPDVPPLVSGPRRFAGWEEDGQMAGLCVGVWEDVLAGEAVPADRWEPIITGLPDRAILEPAPDLTQRAVSAYLERAYVNREKAPEVQAGAEAVKAALAVGMRRIAPLPVDGHYRRWIPASGLLLLSEAEHEDARAYCAILLALRTDA